jgi:hypothetical protein
MKVKEFTEKLQASPPPELIALKAQVEDFSTKFDCISNS